MGVHQLYMSRRRPRGVSREHSSLREEELGQTEGARVFGFCIPLLPNNAGRSPAVATTVLSAQAGTLAASICARLALPQPQGSCTGRDARMEGKPLCPAGFLGCCL